MATFSLVRACMICSATVWLQSVRILNIYISEGSVAARIRIFSVSIIANRNASVKEFFKSVNICWRYELEYHGCLLFDSRCRMRGNAQHDGRLTSYDRRQNFVSKWENLNNTIKLARKPLGQWACLLYRPSYSQFCVQKPYFRYNGNRGRSGASLNKTIKLAEPPKVSALVQ